MNYTPHFLITESNLDYILTTASEFYRASYISVMLTSVLLFPLKELPLEFLVRQVYWWWIPSNKFCLFGKLFTPPSFLKGIFDGISILGDIFSIIFWICHTIFLPIKFLMRNLLIVLWGFPCIELCSCCFKNFCLWVLRI